MSTVTSPIHREPELLEQTVVVIGVGLASDSKRHVVHVQKGAKVTLTGRNAERLQHAASEVDALSTAAFDAADPVALDRFFRDLPIIDHVMVTAGRPYYGRLADMDFAKIRDLIGEHLLRGAGRSKLFGNSADDYLKVHNCRPSQADVTEGSGGIWERLLYDGESD